jgi:hypothetical protein
MEDEEGLEDENPIDGMDKVLGVEEEERPDDN